MSDNAEYDRLVREKSMAERQVNEASMARSNNQSRVNRLINAKKALDECHDNFGDIKKAVNSCIHDHYSWKGSNYDSFIQSGDSLINYNQKYYNNIDDARDAINLEIARLENEVYRQDGLIGDLHSLINSLAHRIENFFN